MSGQPMVRVPGAVGRHDQLRTIRAVFADATEGYRAVDRLRAVGFRIDLAASIAGDLVVSIQAGPTQADEIAALVAAHAGQIERQPASTSESPRPLELAT